jgi:hypothetical protein
MLGQMVMLGGGRPTARDGHVGQHAPHPLILLMLFLSTRNNTAQPYYIFPGF